MSRKSHDQVTEKAATCMIRRYYNTTRSHDTTMRLPNVTIHGHITRAHMTEPGQWPAGSKVTVKLSIGKLDRASSVMATGCSIGRAFK